MGAAASAMIELSDDLAKRTLQDELTEFTIENQGMMEDRKMPHLLFLGKGGSGKTALGNVLTTGRSRGTPGPIGTRQYIESETITQGNMTYIKHDTRGVGAWDTNMREIQGAIQNVYQEHQEECIVIICIRFNDRINDNGNKQSFDLCHSLGPGVWNNVLIAVTHSEVPFECNDDSQLEELKTIWREEVQATVKSYGSTEVPVCFTSHTEAERPIVYDWMKQLLKTIFERACITESYFRFLFQSLRSTLQSVVESGTSELEKTHESLCASITNCPIVTHSLGQDKLLTGGTAAGATIGAVIGAGAGAATALGTGLAVSAGSVAGLAAFGAITIATGGGGALIGVGLGAGIAIATLLVWLWLKRRRERYNN